MSHEEIPNACDSMATADNMDWTTVGFDELLAHVNSLKPEKGGKITSEQFHELTHVIPQQMTRMQHSPTQRDALMKAISASAKCSLKSVRDTCNAFKSASAKETGSVAAPISPDLDCARGVLHHAFDHGQSAIHQTAGTRIWNGSYWELVDPMVIRKHIHDHAESIGAGTLLSKQWVSSVADMFETEAYRNVQFNPFLGHQMVNAGNGELHYKGGQWVLSPACREHYRTAAIPVSFDHAAACPNWERFINSCFEGDEDATQKVQTIMEGFGYSMLTTTIYDRFFMLIGRGANGKSVVMSTLKAMLGSSAICAVLPSQFENRFQRGHMVDKLANIVTELDKKPMDDKTVKAIVSGETITAEHKHKDPFDYEPHCTLWFGMNELPKVDDFSDGLFRRAIMVQFNRSFGVKGQPISGTSHRIADADADPELRLIEKGGGPIAAELPGIMRWALHAIGQAIERGHLTAPASSDALMKEWHMKNDQVAAFVAEECMLDPSAKSSASGLYGDYRAWATRNSTPASFMVSQKTFSERLVNAAPVRAKRENTGVHYHGIITHSANKMRMQPTLPG